MFWVRGSFTSLVNFVGDVKLHICFFCIGIHVGGDISSIHFVQLMFVGLKAVFNDVTSCYGGSTGFCQAKALEG